MTSWYVGKRRLLMLVKKLRTISPERFDYQHWVGENWGKLPDLSCGTTACAAGWATTIPAISRAGLFLTHDGGLGYKNKDGVVVCYYFCALGEVFGINYSEAKFLFNPASRMYDSEKGLLVGPMSPPGDATAKQVARHIEKFIAKKDKAAKS